MRSRCSSSTSANGSSSTSARRSAAPHGRIEAVARTPIMGFREDVTIRVTPDGEDSRVDIRSSSRYFESDFGCNAARVTKLIDDINTAAEATR